MRPLKFKASEDPTEEAKIVLDTAMACFSDVLDSSSDSSFYLQQESVEWGGLIDISGNIEDHSTVHLRCSRADSKVGHWTIGIWVDHVT